MMQNLETGCFFCGQQNRLVLEEYRASLCPLWSGVRSKALSYRKHGVPISLEERNRTIEALHFKDGKTQEQIAEIIGLTQPRIHQILQNINPYTTNIELARENQIAVVRLILKGQKQEDIAEKFGITQGYVSQIKSKYFDGALKAYRDEHLLKREVAERVGLEASEIDAILSTFGDPQKA